MVTIEYLNKIMVKASSICYTKAEDAGQSGDLDLSDELEKEAKNIADITMKIGKTFNPTARINNLNASMSFPQEFTTAEISKIKEAIKIVLDDIEVQQRKLAKQQMDTETLASIFVF